MYDLIIRCLDEDGNPKPGWFRSKPHRAVLLREHLVSVGVAALKDLPRSSPQRATVQAWTMRAGEDGSLPPGTYPLGRGKAALVLEAATNISMAEASARSAIAGASVRYRPVKPGPSARVRSTADAVQAARRLRAQR